ncbi:MAG TPA: hypothetical protein VMZ91_06510 [Candidatus Paceibacterota bacterium]|nr:hypothetical protein [Candidatus Paceibacterota bacterium]
MNKNDLIYAAGFIDGEGCFTTMADKGFRLTITSTDKSILEWFKEKFKGNINGQFLPKNPKHSPAWKWILCKKKDLLTFTLAVLPYLKLKKSEAKTLTDYLSKYPTRKKPNEKSNRYADFIKTKNELKYLKTVHY